MKIPRRRNVPDGWHARELRSLCNGSRAWVRGYAAALLIAGFGCVVAGGDGQQTALGVGMLAFGGGLFAAATRPTVWVGQNGILVKSWIGERRFSADQPLRCEIAQYRGVFTKGRTSIVFWVVVIRRGHDAEPLPVTITTRKRAVARSRELQDAVASLAPLA